MRRNQFTFFRSFFEAICELDAEAQAEAYSAICSYALNEEIPDISGAAKAVFLLAKPNLDTSRKKAESGKYGGGNGQPDSKAEANRKQTTSETEAKRKQNGSKTESIAKQTASKIEIENENENESIITPLTPQGFDRFWQLYPKKIGKQAAIKSWSRLKPNAELTQRILKAVEYQQKSEQWHKNNGQFIPNPATWLNQGRWDDVLPIGFAEGTESEASGPDDLDLLRKQLGMRTKDD